MSTIGLIAGNRKFPLIVAQNALKRGDRIVCAAIRGEAGRSLAGACGSLAWFSLADFPRMLDYFRKEGAREIIMAGQISPFRLFSREVRSSARIQHILSSARDWRPASIFASIGAELEREGFFLIDPTPFFADHLVARGPLTREPTDEEQEDIKFGRGIAVSVSSCDIGLSVAVKARTVIAVEAFEGTDNMIRRAGRLARGITVVKTARPSQDMRFDLPVIGLKTVAVLAKAGGRVLAAESGKTVFIDKDEALRLARRYAISIFGI